MIDKLFNFFFSKTKSAQPLTIVKNREISNKFSRITINKNKQAEVSTCLSKYFKDRKGLNYNERCYNSSMDKISNNA